MIVDSRGLAELARKVVMVDGSFDPLHDGHIAYFEAAAALLDEITTADEFATFLTLPAYRSLP